MKKPTPEAELEARAKQRALVRGGARAVSPCAFRAIRASSSPAPAKRHRRREAPTTKMKKPTPEAG
jgi:hypothetical protein